MKNTMHKMFIIAAASASIASTQVLAQGLPEPDTGPTIVNGTLRIAAPTVINTTGAEDPYLESAVTVASTLQQSQLVSLIIAKGKETEKTGFKKYAYGNKEILQAAIDTTNNPTGYRLVQQSTLDNEDPVLFAVSKTDSFAAEDFSYEAVPNTVALAGTTVKVNEETTISATLTGVSAFKANLPIYGDIPGTANLTVHLRSVVIGAGTNAVTTPYYAVKVNGTFSKVVPTTLGNYWILD